MNNFVRQKHFYSVNIPPLTFKSCLNLNRTLHIHKELSRISSLFPLITLLLITLLFSLSFYSKENLNEVNYICPRAIVRSGRHHTWTQCFLKYCGSCSKERKISSVQKSLRNTELSKVSLLQNLAGLLICKCDYEFLQGE